MVSPAVCSALFRDGAKPVPDRLRHRSAILVVLANPMAVTTGRVRKPAEYPARLDLAAKCEVLQGKGGNSAERNDQCIGNWSRTTAAKDACVRGSSTWRLSSAGCRSGEAARAALPRMADARRTGSGPPSPCLASENGAFSDGARLTVGATLPRAPSGAIHRSMAESPVGPQRTGSAQPLAHVASDGRTHSLSAHLSSVAQLAAEHASAFDGAAHAELAGLWHDVGKYANDFQAKLRAAATIAADAHVEAEDEIAAGRKVDHSTAGAFYAAGRSPTHALPIVFAIAGHHAGLADWSQLRDRLGLR